MPIGILNLGGVRKEEGFFGDRLEAVEDGREAVRASLRAEEVLPLVVEELAKLA